MTQGYFWQVPELTRFRTVFEDTDVVLGASNDNQRRLFRKDTGRICFDEQEAKRLYVELIMEDETTLFNYDKKIKNSVKRITIIGSGASGTLLAANLLRGEANCKLEINLVDKKEKIGRGVAYSTTTDCHLLNVPAAKMSAFADDIEHFYRWLKENDYDYKPSDFVPRKIYGKYLREVISKSIIDNNANAEINIIDDEAVDVVEDEFGAQVILKSGEILFSDQVILAFGNFPPPSPPLSDLSFINSEKYFQNSWDSTIYDKISPNDDVLIIGTGLSMVDVVLNFYQTNHKGKIFALSTHGLLPATHQSNQAIPPFNGEITSQFKVSGIMKTVRERIEEVEGKGGDWRAVIDAMRPVTQTVWLNFDETEKRRFMRHLRRIWDVSRHRMPNECANVLNEMQSAKQLHIKKGRLREINLFDDAKFEVVYANSGLRNKLSVDAIVNCMGSESNLNRIEFPLIKNLIGKGVITTDPLNLGINALPDGRTINKIGSVSDRIFILGMALKGVLWESTAIPEIRTQANKLALSLVS
jgi:uncharacterized NAD(P)/FAD-binding protein YdhS